MEIDFFSDFVARHRPLYKLTKKNGGSSKRDCVFFTIFLVVVRDFSCRSTIFAKSKFKTDFFSLIGFGAQKLHKFAIFRQK